MRVALEPFALAGLESRFGPSVLAGTQMALRHYARRLCSPREPVAIPEFRRAAPPSRQGAELELAVSTELELVLKREARRQAVTVERLVSHAVFVYLSDLDARAAARAPSAQEDERERRYRFDAYLGSLRSPARNSASRSVATVPAGRRGRGARSRGRCRG